MTGESLRAYNKDRIDANTNNGWQQYNPSVSSASQMAAYNTPLFNSASGYPSVNGWPNNWTSSDPILNFGSTSTDLNCSGSGFTNALGYITGGLTAATGLLGLGTGIASLFKKDNSGNSSSEAADSTLASLVESANNYDKKSDKVQMQNTSNCLTEQIKTVNNRLKTARQNKMTAEKTLTGLSTEKETFVKQLSTFDDEKVKSEGELTTLEGDMTTLKGELYTLETTSPIDNNAINAKKKAINEKQKAIDEKKKAIKEQYSDSKRKLITDQISRIEKDEEKWKVTLKAAEQDMKQLPDEIDNADKAIKRLNKLIEKN